MTDDPTAAALHLDTAGQRALWHHAPMLLRFFGARWLAYRVQYALARRSGLMRRRAPAVPWSACPLADFCQDQTLVAHYLDYRRQEGARFFFAPTDRTNAFAMPLRRWDTDSTAPMHDADRLAQGTFRYFGQRHCPVGLPPDWHANPFSGQRAPTDLHWTEISHAVTGDIKAIWELSRFTFAYTLVRAWWRTADECYPELFWQLVEDWQANNPPQQGANWACGQEVSIRAMAWCFGLYGFLDAPATTAARVALLAQTIAVSGQRIAANIGYALSQRNNHGISEAVGLWTIGLLFPEFRDAAKWRDTGRHLLETLARDLIYDDGAFAQHSANYQRMVIQSMVWATRLGDLNGNPLGQGLRDRLRSAGRFLYQMQDADSGQVPNYGHNDGSLILPLNNCDFSDFRPAIQMAHFLCDGERAYQSGPWDEDLLWLFGPDSQQASCHTPARADLETSGDSCHTLRSTTGFTMIRCPTFRHRPAHADALHVDLWWHGHNIALDAGSYRYNAPPPWDNALAHTAYHNTVTVDRHDQMCRVSRFIWLPWLQSRAGQGRHSPNRQLVGWTGEHNGYRRLHPGVNHRRSVVAVGTDHWLVLDRLSSTGPHTYRLHWLLADALQAWDSDTGRVVLRFTIGDYHIQLGALGTTATFSLVRADPNSPRGWRSPTYFCRQPALSLDCTAHGDTVWFWTLFGPRRAAVTVEGPPALAIHGEGWQARIVLQDSTERSGLVQSVEWTATNASDRLAW